MCKSTYIGLAQCARAYAFCVMQNVSNDAAAASPVSDSLSAVTDVKPHIDANQILSAQHLEGPGPVVAVTRTPAARFAAVYVPHAPVVADPHPRTPPGPAATFFILGAAAASFLASGLQFLVRERSRLTTPVSVPYLPPDPFGPDVPPLPPALPSDPEPPPQDILPDAESVEWVNMCVRKVWRVYQRGLEKWISELLQPVFDTYINDDTQPAILKRIRIEKFALNHEAPVLSKMQRKNSRKENDINGVFGIRYSGGAKLLLVLELGGKLKGLEVPVMVEDFDLDARMWIKLRLAPMCPWIGVISLAFVEQPRIQVCLDKLTCG
jgi:hypothetical protein